MIRKKYAKPLTMVENEHGSDFLTLSTLRHGATAHNEHSVSKMELKLLLLTISDFSSYVEMCFIVFVD